jgi:hypothetical protein
MMPDVVPMPSRLIVIRIAFDEEAAVWYVEHSDLPGLRAEAATADGLMQRIPALVADLMEENGGTGEAREIPIEIIASRGTRVHLRASA